MKYVIGLDPGGRNQFGWGVCRAEGSESLTLVESGTVDHAPAEIEAAISALPSGESPAVAGIDAPMFWVADGKREVDTLVRKAIEEGVSSLLCTPAVLPTCGELRVGILYVRSERL